MTQEQSETVEFVAWALEKLKPRLKTVLTSRHYEGKTLEEVGQKLKLTRARICQLQQEGERRLRRIIEQELSENRNRRGTVSKQKYA